MAALSWLNLNIERAKIKKYKDNKLFSALHFSFILSFPEKSTIEYWNKFPSFIRGLIYYNTIAEINFFRAKVFVLKLFGDFWL